LESIPRIDRQKDRLPSIKGTVPRIGAHYQGCAFRERCPFAQSRCAADSPPLTGLAGRLVRCWRYAEGNS
jgi:oligopeptide/dipeptide ABC transporter ATP-binding protein